MKIDVLPGTGRPGGSAEQKYDAMVSSWRSSAQIKRIRWVCVALGTACLIAGATTGDALAFNLGVFASGFFGFWFAVRDLAVPEYIERWRRGAQGEKWTAKELRKLGPDWEVRHDLQGRFGNVDHVAVGPAGVFLLDSKAWFHGSTTITSDGPVVASRHDEDLVWQWTGLPGRMRAAAAGASDGLRSLAGHRLYVTPVVVIWGDFPGKVQERCGVVYVEGEHLHAWLSTRPARLSERDIAALARLY